jgi:hypothetical protein
VAAWSGWSLRFTDGICPACLTRFRDEHRAFIDRQRVLTPREAA